MYSVLPYSRVIGSILLISTYLCISNAISFCCHNTRCYTHPIIRRRSLLSTHGLPVEHVLNNVGVQYCVPGQSVVSHAADNWT